MSALKFGDGRPPLLGAQATLAQMLRAQAARTPDAVAVTDEHTSLTYHELLTRAESKSSLLRQHGAGPDQIVIVCGERSTDLVVAMTAVLLADAAYLPIDPHWPVARIAHIAAEAKPAAVLCDKVYTDLLNDSVHVPMVAIDDESVAPQHNHEASVSQSDLAYVIYTSGSTGWPKGVAVPHQGIVNRLRWMQAQYQLTGEDRVLQKTPYTFDVSVWEFFWPLTVGATLVMSKPDGHKDPGYLAELIAAERITTLHFVPSMLAVFLQEPSAAAHCASVTRVITSGEALSPALANQAREVFTNAAVHNLYGPTEASVDVTYWPCRDVEPGPTVPIGYPINGVIARVLDPERRPVPIGEPGELYLGGVCLARGYLGRPDLTEAAFVTDPAEPGQRFYRTGDLVRWTPEGYLEFLGRLDHQVKLRGLRIELGEIESAALDHPSVRGAIAMVREDVGSTPKLVLYVAGSDTGLREHLAERLPDYMVPSFVVALDELPLTANGKCDRQALPRPIRQSTGQTRRRPVVTHG